MEIRELGLQEESLAQWAKTGRLGKRRRVDRCQGELGSTRQYEPYNDKSWFLESIEDVFALVGLVFWLVLLAWTADVLYRLLQAAV